MSEPIRFIPIPNKKGAYALFFGLMLSAVAALAAQRFVTAMVWIPQLAGVVLAVAAIAVYTKYLSGRYEYSVQDGALWVTKREGKRVSTLLRVALLTVASVAPQTAEERKAEKLPAKCKKYRHFASLNPALVAKITFREGGAESVAYLEATEAFCMALSDAVTAAKRAHTAEND